MVRASWIASWIVLATCAGCVSERREPLRGAPVAATDDAGSEGDDGAGGGDDGGGREDGADADDGAEDGGDGGPCEDGAVEECLVEVGEQAGKKTCFPGKRRCREGSWGSCRWKPGDGEG